MNATLIILVLAGSAVAADPVADSVKVNMQKCFDSVGRRGFEVLAYSAKTRALVYEVDGRQTVTLRPEGGFAVIGNGTAASCHSIDGSSTEALVISLKGDALKAVRLNPSTDVGACDEAMRLLGFADQAAQLRIQLRELSKKSDPTPSAR